MLRTLISGAIGFSIAACAAERSATPPAQRGQSASLESVARAAEPDIEPAKPANREICPGHEPHTRVGFEELGSGAALVLTTSDDIAELRRRAARLSLPDTLQRSEPRLDNIHAGVRIVLDTYEGADVSSLRHSVDEHARRIVDVCGLVLAAPSEPPSGSAQPIEPQRKIEKAKDDKTKAADPKKQIAASSSKKVGAKPQPKVDSAPKPKPKPKAAVRPADAPKPPAKKLPRKKHPVPPLPGIPRQPLPPPPTGL